MLLYTVVLFFLSNILSSIITTPITCAELPADKITELALSAARCGHYKTLKIALKYFKVNPNTCDSNATPLLCIIAENYQAPSHHHKNGGIFNEPLTNNFFKCLLKLCAQPHLNCNSHDKEGNTALHLLLVKILHNSFTHNRTLFDAITLLIQCGCSLHKKNSDNLSAYDLIQLYAHHYHTYGKALLRFCQDIKNIPIYYKKIACDAAYQGDYATLKMCLKFYKTSPNSSNKHHEPLLSIVIQNYTPTPTPTTILHNYTRCIMALLNKKHKLIYTKNYQYFLLKKISGTRYSQESHQEISHIYTLLLNQNTHSTTHSNSFENKNAVPHPLALPHATYENMAYQAACQGHFDILGKCLKYYTVNPSLIVYDIPLICHVAHNYNHARYQNNRQGPFGCSYDSNYFLCLTKLCSRPSKLSINATDCQGNTALHCLIIRLHHLWTQKTLLHNESFVPACHLLLEKKISPTIQNIHNLAAPDSAHILLKKRYPQAQALIRLLQAYTTTTKTLV